jgi:uncharacterized pyridoxamine 5'-phosphate oxidase family protein
MGQPQPTPIEVSELPALAQATMKAAKFPVLATVEGEQPRVRPVSPVRTEGFTVYVANLRRYGKTAEIAANPKVELCYTDEEHNQVRITAEAEVVTEAGILGEIWEGNPLLRAYLRTPENPELIVYRMKALRVRYMREWALEYYEVPIR